MGIRKMVRWRIIGGAILFLLPIWQFVRFLVQIAGDVDFVVSRSQDPGWVGLVINFFIDPPPWVNLPLIIGGLALIYWDIRLRNSKPNDPYPLKVSSPTSETRIHPKQYTSWYVLLENVSLSTVDDISVILDTVNGKNIGTRANEPFQSDRGPVFSLRPGERAWVTIAQTLDKFSIGPLASGRTIRGWRDDNSYVTDSTIRASIVCRQHPIQPLFLTCDEARGVSLAVIKKSK